MISDDHTLNNLRFFRTRGEEGAWNLWAKRFHPLPEKARLVCVAFNEEIGNPRKSNRKHSKCAHQSRINNKLFNVAVEHDESIIGDSGKGFN